jgi:methyl-accepting chemotaxis protein
MIGCASHMNDLQATTRAHLLRVVAVVLLALFSGGYLVWCVYKVMDGGLQETHCHLRAMIDGGLTTSPSLWSQDEPAQLMIDLHGMQDSPCGMVARVRQFREEIVRSSCEIPTAAEELGRFRLSDGTVARAARYAGGVRSTSTSTRRSRRTGSGR